MDKKGRAAMEVLLMLVVVVVTSSVVLLLVHFEVVGVKAASSEPVLNVDFLPVVREGSLVVKDFKFCSYVNDENVCVEEKAVFGLGERVYFRFVVESSALDGEVRLVENYRLKGPDEKVMLEVDDKYNNYLNKETEREEDTVFFKDYVLIEESDPVGEYTFELVVENPLLDKSIVLTEEFVIK